MKCACQREECVIRVKGTALLPHSDLSAFVFFQADISLQNILARYTCYILVLVPFSSHSWIPSDCSACVLSCAWVSKECRQEEKLDHDLQFSFTGRRKEGTRTTFVDQIFKLDKCDWIQLNCNIVQHAFTPSQSHDCFSLLMEFWLNVLLFSFIDGMYAKAKFSIIWNLFPDLWLVDCTYGSLWKCPGASQTVWCIYMHKTCFVYPEEYKCLYQFCLVQILWPTGGELLF